MRLYTGFNPIRLRRYSNHDNPSVFAGGSVTMVGARFYYSLWELFRRGFCSPPWLRAIQSREHRTFWKGKYPWKAFRPWGARVWETLSSRTHLCGHNHGNQNCKQHKHEILFNHLLTRLFIPIHHQAHFWLLLHLCGFGCVLHM